MNEPGDEDTWTGSLIPGVLADAIQQAEDEQEAAAAVLAQLADGPSITEAAANDRRWWDGERDGETNA